MELKEFIKETIVQVIDGVIEAQDVSKIKGAQVNPVDALSANVDEVYMANRQFIGLIKFEVALTSAEEREGKGGIGVWLGNFGVGAQGKTDSKDQSVTNIKFAIPVQFPKS